MSEKLDIGCGAAKPAGFDGLDIYPYEGVDIVHDLGAEGDWPIEDNRYSLVRAWHVIEHLRDLRKFFTEVHRVAKNGAGVYIATPHYSSRNSWADPTHLHHLSVDFCDTFLEGGYLAPHFPRFKRKHRRITFGGVLFTWPGRTYCRLLGCESFEKHFAWIIPASSIIVELEVVK